MNYTIAEGTTLPSWLSFEPSKRKFSGIPLEYSRQNISITATDTWGGKTTMTFTLITGKRPNTPPRIKTPLKDLTAYRNQLFYYKILETAFEDEDGDALFFLVSDETGALLPEWLFYEEAGKIVSGIPRLNNTDVTILIIADDQQGGSATQRFTVKVKNASLIGELWPIIVIGGILLLFIVIVVYVMCKGSGAKSKKKKKKTPTGEESDGIDSDSDSFEEGDDICIEQQKPKHPKKFDRKANNPDDIYSAERFKYYGTKVPEHAKVKVANIQDAVAD